MKKQYFHTIILLSIIGFLVPIAAHAVNTYPEGSAKEKKELPEEKKIDGLSLIAYMSTVAGIASFFLVPAASLILLPAGFLLGMIARLGKRKRYETRRGRGLALAAILLGGAYTLFLFSSFLVFALFGF